jgi:hypothetical protein
MLALDWVVLCGCRSWEIRHAQNGFLTEKSPLSFGAQRNGVGGASDYGVAIRHLGSDLTGE